MNETAELSNLSDSLKEIIARYGAELAAVDAQRIGFPPEAVEVE